MHRLFNHGSGGVIGNGNPGDSTETARGWVGGIGGNNRAVVGADLPKRIYVRWQSAVEPQTYRAWIDIGDEARQIMYDSTHQRCKATPERTARYMAALYLGLARESHTSMGDGQLRTSSKGCPRSGRNRAAGPSPRKIGRALLSAARSI